ncbi:spherulin-2A-like [Ostrinia furnacalis]|uniref:spherulin-2A-like n=1 Tax=Ostrinia furnacalis TaxID=93504 RepID=UPI00103C0AB0|nr:spherulin-2A-like [Ostrinia furnacalis]
MAFLFILLALPALALARIDIEVAGKFDPNNQNMQVYYSGNEVAIISDEERNTFKIGDSALKDAVRSYFGQRPDDAYLRSPTPWGDLYQTYGWSQVTRTLVPRSAKVLTISSQPQIVMRQLFENNSTKPATFNVGISQTVQNTVSSSWSTGGQLTIGQEISYGINIEGIVGGGAVSYSYTNSWGRNTEQSQSVTIGASSGMEVLLQPGQGVVAELEATRGSMKVEVEYLASLDGANAVNYAKTYKGHHFWALDVRGVMSSGGISNAVVSREVLEIGFYSNAKVVVHDRALGTKFFEMSV